ncbi:DEAD/DEAH box helicase [Streptomyces sp. 11-1-2]|uniref:DEAD/DEAH box helicase n=1 Tax=unclassified Streptomyces TaxID=2593676 RepID=UPI000B8D542E|nr:DEAD/DEAH box helicase [Streptomyces sp. 11-1-2]ASR00416.1 DEAD/DEAH box helicase [Streptomyces sp. 11-1-2]
MTLPVALSGTDVIGQAKTGTGKTLGFGLPLLERVVVSADVEAGRAKPEQLTDAPQALVVVPTRELCQQVTNDLLTAGKVRAVRVLSIYGGRAYEPQVEALKKGVDVVVGTPGRLLDLAGQKKLRLSSVKALVLDEADEMLDLGFLPDVEKIIQLLPAKRQTMLFSATMPGQVISLARRYMSQPTHIRATAPDDEGATVANITQHVFRAHSMDKPEVVARVLQADGRGLAMIFCRTKRTAADIADQLARRGFASGAVHGDLGQGAREQALRAFRNGKVDVLVCTDVAARGIDVEGVTHVINYQSPEDEKTYLHRIGRTGRAGASGIAITLVDWDDIPRWQLINKALDLAFHEPEETYSTSEHLFELLNIPEGTTGVLPRGERTRAGLAAEEIEDLGETGGRGGRGRRAAATPATEERPPRNRRVRRRTRGGMTTDGTGAPEGAAAAESAADTAEGATEPRRPRRRRRTRGGAATAHPEAATAAVDTAETAQPEAEPTEASAKPRRRRTRGAARTAEAATAAVETAEGTEGTTQESASTVAVESAETAVTTVEATEAAVEAPTKPRRRTRAKAAEAAQTAVETAEGTMDAVKAAETVEAQPEAVEAPAKPRRRTRAKAAEAAEAAVETAEGTAEAATPRRRTRATAKADTADAQPETEATEAPAKPRRTRAKATKAAEAAVETAEGTAEATDAAEAAKPRRRTRAKAAEAAETAEGTAEAATPRRRTRAATKADTADAQPETEAAEAPAKPRRTRAKAATAAPAADEAGAEAAPAKPRRRTRAEAVEAAAEG